MRSGQLAYTTGSLVLFAASPHERMYDVHAGKHLHGYERKEANYVVYSSDVIGLSSHNEYNKLHDH